MNPLKCKKQWEKQWTRGKDRALIHHQRHVPADSISGSGASSSSSMSSSPSPPQYSTSPPPMETLPELSSQSATAHRQVFI